MRCGANPSPVSTVLIFCMTPNPNPRRASVSLSSSEPSEQPTDPSETQLSAQDGVETDVSTAALDRSMLMAASASPMSAVFSAGSGPEAPSDADVMLRVKTGDQSAFDYLV